MFTIGDFATFTQVSIPALRLWDRRGLLAPARVDEQSGYRYYSAEQATIVLRIVALKSLGFTLADIARLLDTPPTHDELLNLLAELRRETEQERRRVENRIAMIEASLRILERDDLVSHPNDIIRKTAPAVRLVALSQTLPAADDQPDRLFTVFGSLFADLGARLDALGVVPIGPAWSLYERSDDTGITVHAALPIAPGVRVTDPALAVIDRPETDVISTVHLGDLAEMGVAYAALMAWIDEHGLSPAGGSAEISLAWNPDHPEQNVTELQFPVHERKNPTMALSAREKFDRYEHGKLSVLESDFAGVPAGSLLYISTPRELADRVRAIPSGQTVSIPELRAELAADRGGDATCPVTTAIYLRIVLEVVLDDLAQGLPIDEVTPIWRVLAPDSPVTRRVDGAPEFVAAQRAREGIA